MPTHKAHKTYNKKHTRHPHKSHNKISNNINPQASYDLANDVKHNSSTFKQYLNSINTKLATTKGGSTTDYNKTQALTQPNAPETVQQSVLPETDQQSVLPETDQQSVLPETSQPSAPETTIPSITNPNINYVHSTEPNLNQKTETNPSLTDDTTMQPSIDTQQITNQVAGGYTTDPSEFIAGNPVYKAYDDCCPPAIIGGDLKFGSPGNPVCGVTRGGGHNKKHRSVGNKTKSKKHRSVRNKTKSNKHRSVRNKTKSNKHRSVRNKTKSKKHRSVHNNNQKGGDWVGMGRSKPAKYNDAFNGPVGNFTYPDNMMQRTFDETQQNYSVNAI